MSQNNSNSWYGVEVQIIDDSSSLSAQENNHVREFHENCEVLAKSSGVSVSDGFTMLEIAEKMGLPVLEYPKEGVFVQALWVTYLQVMRKYLDSTFNFKYPKLSDFLEAYNGQFNGLDKQEQIYLWETANWMSILFTIISPKKNKGLAMQVIPKLVEGWQTKYVTGSGQTKATAQRVHIFETEGDVQANSRSGRGRHKKSSNKSESQFSETITTKKRGIPRQREVEDVVPILPLKRRRQEVHKRDETIPEDIYANPINASKFRSHLAHMQQQSNGQDGERTDNDDDSICDEQSQSCLLINSGGLTQADKIKAEGGSSAFQLFRMTSLETDILDTQAPSLQRGISANLPIRSTEFPVISNDFFKTTSPYDFWLNDTVEFDLMNMYL